MWGISLIVTSQCICYFPNIFRSFIIGFTAVHAKYLVSYRHTIGSLRTWWKSILRAYATILLNVEPIQPQRLRICQEKSAIASSSDCQAVSYISKYNDIRLTRHQDKSSYPTVTEKIPISCYSMKFTADNLSHFVAPQRWRVIWIPLYI